MKNNHIIKIFNYILLVFFFLSIQISTYVRGNPVGVSVGPDPFYSLFFFLGYIICIFGEFYALYVLFERINFAPEGLFKKVFAINFFTYPITQFFLFLLIFLSRFDVEPSLGLIFIIIVEIFPILTEFGYYNSLYTEEIGEKKVFLYTVIVNFVSFLIGGLNYLPYVIISLSI